MSDRSGEAASARGPFAAELSFFLGGFVPDLRSGHRSTSFPGRRARRWRGVGSGARSAISDLRLEIGDQHLGGHFVSLLS